MLLGVLKGYGRCKFYFQGQLVVFWGWGGYRMKFLVESGPGVGSYVWLLSLLFRYQGSLCHFDD